MKCVPRLTTLLAAVLTVALLSAASVAYAGPFDKLKAKAENKANQKTDKAADSAVDKASNAVDDAVSGKGKSAGEESGEGKSSASGSAPGGGGKVSSVSTKFDYVPGDSVIFFDDFTQDELGEFPARWRLNGGNFEVAEMEGERWLRCTSADGHIRMKIPNLVVLPALPSAPWATRSRGSGRRVIPWEIT
jgi:hypothetical protein